MPAWLPIALGASAALDSLSSGKSASDANSIAERQAVLNEQQYAEREPLRALGLSRLLQARPERPDLSGDFADPSNPFARAPRPLGFGSEYGSQEAPTLDKSLADYRALGMGPWGKSSGEAQRKQADREAWKADGPDGSKRFGLVRLRPKGS